MLLHGWIWRSHRPAGKHLPTHSRGSGYEMIERVSLTVWVPSLPPFSRIEKSKAVKGNSSKEFKYRIPIQDVNSKRYRFTVQALPFHRGFATVSPYLALPFHRPVGCLSDGALRHCFPEGNGL